MDSYVPITEMAPGQLTAVTYVIILTAILSLATLKERIHDLSRYSWKSAMLNGRLTDQKTTAHSPIALGIHKLAIAQQTPPLPSLLGTSIGSGEALLLVGLLLLNIALVILPVPFPASVDTELLFDLNEISKRAAWVATGNLFYILITATRNSLLTFLTGVAFERTLVWHRWLGYLVLAELAIHAGLTMQYYSSFRRLGSEMTLPENLFGIAGFACCALFTVFSLPAVRRRAFRLFYYTHFLFLPFLVFSILHRVAVAWFIALGLVLYVIDRTLRFVRSRTQVELLDIRPLSSKSGAGCTRLVVMIGREPRDWEAGQYAFLSIPGVGTGLDYYPMSVSSSPDFASRSGKAGVLRKVPTAFYFEDGTKPSGTIATFHIKAAGGFTSDLYSTALSLLPSAAPSVDLENQATALARLSNLRVDGFHGSTRLEFTSFPCVALVAGGIGITPMLSIARDLAHRMQLRLPNGGSVAWKTGAVYLLWYARDWEEFSWFRGELGEMWGLARKLKEDGAGRLVVRVFLTRSELASDASQIERANVFSAKPEPKQLLEDVRARYPGDVATAVCGPARLVRDVREAGAKLSSEGGMMGVHWESFEF